ncbi:MAG: response regulator transcription factor [Chitinophagaceae bacterium]|nr:MAG: response regulator transcription factor [Chitinophagaceae bacterium]
MKECSVALIDDHELMRNGLQGIVNGFDGYCVTLQAVNGKDFIEQVKKNNKPAIALVDITMPVMNGYDTAAWIKKNLPDTRILALSMLDNESAVIKMLKNGASGYVLKDSKPSHLLQALNAVRDSGFFMNDMVNSRVIHYLNSSEENSKHKSLLANITDREAEFLVHAATEMSYKEIAENMKVSPRTVEGYRDSLFFKLDLKTRVGLVMFGIRNGLIQISN